MPVLIRIKGIRSDSCLSFSVASHQRLVASLREEMTGSARTNNDAAEYGGSLPVPNVQVLATKELKEIPSRYIRPEFQSDVVISTDESLDIPVIDLSSLLLHQDSSEEVINFHAACRDWGFFHLINHGVPDDVIEKMKADTEEFFRLPLEEKNAYAQLPNNIEGYGQAFVVSQDQKLDWGDMLFFISLPASHRKLRFWPEKPASYRETIDEYSKALQKVTVILVGLMAKNLGLEPEKLSELFENDGSQSLRMNYYPPCPQADKVMGLSPHSDATGLTLLLQVNQVEGLQIRKDGNWIPIKPIPGAFVVNIGDIIEIMSNGVYKSIEHRAVVNPNTERLSVAAFHRPNLCTAIGPLPDLVKGNRENYKTISHDDFLKQSVNSKLDGKSLLDRMKT